VFDLTIQAIQTSLDGLAARQRIIATNVANSETPGYLSQNVNFEDSLRAAVAGGDPGSTNISTTTSNAPTLPNGQQRERRRGEPWRSSTPGCATSSPPNR